MPTFLVGVASPSVPDGRSPVSIEEISQKRSRGARSTITDGAFVSIPVATERLRFYSCRVHDNGVQLLSGRSCRERRWKVRNLRAPVVSGEVKSSCLVGPGNTKYLMWPRGPFCRWPSGLYLAQPVRAVSGELGGCVRTNEWSQWVR
jgi:hypothetical protein